MFTTQSYMVFSCHGLQRFSRNMAQTICDWLITYSVSNSDTEQSTYPIHNVSETHTCALTQGIAYKKSSKINMYCARIYKNDEKLTKFYIYYL